MLLYIEDNTLIAKNVIQYLETENFHVKRVTHGEIGLQEALKKSYECILLDVMLPDGNGFDICKEIRKHKKTPIIMTTAKGEIEDKGIGFEQGADDYLVKPFELAELVMRIRAVLQRTQVSDTVKIQDVEFIIDENRCLKSGKDIKLTLKEWQILIELLDVPGRTVSRSDIVDSVRGGEALFESTGKLDVYIANIRKKLGKEIIQTIKGLGYKIPIQ